MMSANTTLQFIRVRNENVRNRLPPVRHVAPLLPSVTRRLRHGAVALQQERVTRVTNAHRLGRRRQRHLVVATLATEDVATVATVVLASRHAERLLALSTLDDVTVVGPRGVAQHLLHFFHVFHLQLRSAQQCSVTI